MNIIARLAELEKEIVSYADAAGKGVEQVFDEIKTYIVNERVKLENAAAGKSNPTVAGGGVAGTAANPTTSGPADASAGSQVIGAASTGKSS